MEVLATCHVHSEWSYDARWSLKDLRKEFSHRGSRILLMTEHDRGFTAERFNEYRAACVEASSAEMLVVPGMEYSDDANRVHVLVWGVPFLGEGLRTHEMLQAVKQANGVAVLAHPSRRDVWRDFNPQWAECLSGVEVWNRKYDGWAPSKTADALLESGAHVPFVGLDFHTNKQFFSLNMALELPAGATEETVLNCLRSRKCQARAFSLPLEHNLLRSAMPTLAIAESGRRKAASIVKRSKRQSSSEKEC